MGVGSFSLIDLLEGLLLLVLLVSSLLLLQPSRGGELSARLLDGCRVSVVNVLFLRKVLRGASLGSVSDSL